MSSKNWSFQKYTFSEIVSVLRSGSGKIILDPLPDQVFKKHYSRKVGIGNPFLLNFVWILNDYSDLESTSSES